MIAALFPAFPVDYLVAALVTLTVVVDPLGLVPIFLAITQGMPRSAKRQVALRAALIAAMILAGAALAGDWLLRMLSISLPAFRIAGGLLLFSIASEMVFGVRIKRQSEDAEQALDQHVRDISAFPLAIPLMAGPGAITAVVLLSGRAAGDMTLLAILLGVIVFVCGLCIAAFFAANGIGRVIGATTNTVLERLLGVVLAALAVQFVVDGVKEIWS
jgi:multiple antibiotic resistance protein